MESDVLLALALGLVLGATPLVVRSVRRRLRRSSRGAASMFLPDVAPTRTASDIFSGRVRVTLGGREYVLPVLSWDESNEWLDALDEQAAGTLAKLDDAGDDGAEILALLEKQTDSNIAALVAWDKTGVLPSRAELVRLASGAELMRAAMEVWLAANPLVVTVVRGSLPTSGRSSVQPSTQRTPMAGDPTTSTASPPSRSSPTSMPRPTDDPRTPSANSTTPLRLSASATSSPVARRPRRSGSSDAPALRAVEG